MNDLALFQMFHLGYVKPGASYEVTTIMTTLVYMAMAIILQIRIEMDNFLFDEQVGYFRTTSGNRKPAKLSHSTDLCSCHPLRNLDHLQCDIGLSGSQKQHCATTFSHLGHLPECFRF